MPTSIVKWRVTYGGPLLEQSEMDVRDLAPSLLAIADLCEAASHTLYGDALTPRVRVHASFRTGSFGIELAVDAGFVARVLDIFTSRPVDGGLALVTMIGLLYKLIRFLRQAKGRNVVGIEREGAEPVAILEDGERVGTEDAVIALLQSRRVTENLYKVLEPLARDGIDDVGFGDDTHVEERVERKELPYFVLAQNDLQIILIDDHRRMVVSAVSVAFREENKWRVTDGNSTFFVSIVDTDFLRRVDEGESFAKGDTFVCDVWVRQWDGPAALSTDYTIEKVVEHRRWPPQLRLPLPNDADEPPSSE